MAYNGYVNVKQNTTHEKRLDAKKNALNGFVC